VGERATPFACEGRERTKVVGIGPLRHVYKGASGGPTVQHDRLAMRIVDKWSEEGQFEFGDLQRRKFTTRYAWESTCTSGLGI